MDGIGARGSQAGRQPFHEFQVVAPADHLVGGNADQNGEFGAHRTAHGRDDFQDEAHPVFFGASVGVRSLIREGGKELRQQVSMGAVDLDGIEARLFRPDRGPGEGVDHGGDSVRAHRLAGLVQYGAGDCGRRLRHPAGGHLEGLPAGVVELQGGLCPLPVHGVGELCQAGDEIIAPNADLVPESLPPGQHSADLRDDQADAASCPAGQVGDQAVADGAVRVPVAGAHGGHDGPVSQGHAVDGER